jgi:hypothetical protein
MNLSGPAQVIVDYDDDVATVRAVKALRQIRSDMLVVSVSPTASSTIDLPRDILREHARVTDEGARVPHYDWSWAAALRWLQASGVSDLVMLYAQHIERGYIEPLAARLQDGQIRLTLVYTGDSDYVQPNILLDELLEQAATGQRDRARTNDWPVIPAVHALRLRYECRLSLSSDQFTEVEDVLHDVFGRLSRWLDTQPDVELLDLSRAVSSVVKCTDERQLQVRSAGADLALISARRSANTTSRRLSRTNLLESKASPDDREADGGWRRSNHHRAHTTVKSSDHSSRRAITTIEELLHELLYTDRRRVHHSRIPGDLKESIDDLCAQDVLGYDADDQCSATAVARYGAFQQLAMPIRRESVVMQFLVPNSQEPEHVCSHNSSNPLSET